MNASTIIFYLLATLVLLGGIMAVTSRQIFRAAISLLFSLIGMAGLYFWLNYEFIAAVQIVVYVGGITVLIIFSIFLTQQAGEKLPLQKSSAILLALLAAAGGFSFLWMQLAKRPFTEVDGAAGSPSMAEIGKRMLNTEMGGYALPFEVISILLLAAMIGCIVIAMRRRGETN